jgi:hypothetical protein
MTSTTCQRSIIEDCIREALAYKWIESQKAGYDLGEEAVKRWAKLHWKAYLRARRLEHLEGKIFWQELDCNDFGILLNGFMELVPLLYRIFDTVTSGRTRFENLDIINWALDERIPIAQVRTVLLALRINELCRLPCPLTPADPPPTS